MDGFFFHDAEGNATSRFKCWIYSINFHSELESYKIVNVCLNTPTFKHLFTISSDHWYSKINFDHKKEKKKHLVNLLYLKEKNETIYFSIFISTDGSTIVTQEDIILPTWRNRSSLLGLLLFPESFLLIKTTSKVSNCKYMCKAMPSKKTWIWYIDIAKFCSRTSFGKPNGLNLFCIWSYNQEFFFPSYSIAWIIC